MSGGNLLLSKDAVLLPELTGSYNLTGGTVTFNGAGTSSNGQTIRPVNYFNLSAASTGDRIPSNTGTTGIGNIFTPSSNIYTIAGSTINFNKANIQNIPGFSYYNLTLSGGNFTKTLTGNISIEGTLTFVANTKLALVNQDVVLKSGALNTAAVAGISTANSITYGTGRFIIERFIPTGLAHGKSWQFLSVPTTMGQTVKAAWQEGAVGGPFDNPNPGYGTQLTSNLAGALALGFDFYTPAGSTMKTYNSALNQWQGVSSTAIPIANKNGYMLFVRGDRSVTAYNQASVPVTMRTKGKLYSPGADAPAAVTVAAGKFESVGNPYASAIDFLSLIGTSTGLDSVYYVWDPLLPGSNGFGAYQTISKTNNFVPTPGGTTNYRSAVPYTKLQSGQAFFVFSTPGESVSFTENNKIAGSQLVYRRITNNGNPERQYLRAYLYTETGALADGNVVAFDPLFDDGYETNDAIKLVNFGENFGISNNNKTLSVKARQTLMVRDTIFYHIENLRMQGYQIRFAPESMRRAGLIPFLVDKFTGINYSLSLTDSSFFDFRITQDAGSKGPNRFYIVFKKLNPVPVTFTGISAIANGDGSIAVNWKVENEVNIEYYEVERSDHTQTFNSINKTTAAINNGGTIRYNHIDASPQHGNNFYRIKALGRNGQVQYSPVVKVPLKCKPLISIYPNPVAGKIVSFFFSDPLIGQYRIQVISNQGQVILSNRINITNGSDTSVTLEIGNEIAKGVYHLRIISDNGFESLQKIIIQ